MTMKSKMLWVPVLLALAGAAVAQEGAATAQKTAPAAQKSAAVADDSGTLLDYVTQACQADLDKFCSQVTPGEGRMLYCVAAHQDKISDQCTGALADAAMILADVTDRVVSAAEACGPELNQHCGDVEVGEGRVLACLDKVAEKSDTCEAAVDDLTDPDDATQ
jgi:hypothetical protein